MGLAIGEAYTKLTFPEHTDRRARLAKCEYGHAYFARRANVPQPARIDPNPKSAASSAPSRLHKEGVSRSSRDVGSGMRWTRQIN
jgi:hypothetical protein